MAGDHENSNSGREEAGLCGRCRFMLEQGTRRGGVFIRCTRADEDRAFDRYPAIPVLSCRGFEGRAEAPGME